MDFSFRLEHVINGKEFGKDTKKGKNKSSR